MGAEWLDKVIPTVSRSDVAVNIHLPLEHRAYNTALSNMLAATAAILTIVPPAFRELRQLHALPT
jgi:hypothetical protein